MVSFSVIWSIWSKVLICGLVCQAQEAHRQKRQSNPCPGGDPVDLPAVSKSQMCRCLHRPDYQDPTTAEFTPTPQNVYMLDVLPIDYDNFGPTFFPGNANAVCVYFGHAGTNVPALQVTPEFVLQAINEHGWPTGTWSVVTFKATCRAPTALLRSSISNITLFDYRQCYEDDRSWGQEEGFYTEGNKNDHPTLLHFFNPVVKTYGITALLHVNVHSPALRPQKLTFVAEAPYRLGNKSQPVKMFRIQSPTYNVHYDPNGELLTLMPSPTVVNLNLDYSYQVRTKNLKPPNPDTCLEPPRPAPPIPMFPENGCACFITPRQPTQEKLAGIVGNTVIHNRLNLSSTIPAFEQNKDVPAEIQSFYIKYNHDYVYHPTKPGMEEILVYIYHFLPVFKDRRFREREVVISAFDHSGFPVGVFLDPFLPGEAEIYNDACDEAVQSLNSSTIRWTRPPMPAVGLCNPPDPSVPQNKKPCYFHFYTDYFYVDCQDACEEPKYICAVWKYVDLPNTSKKPFEFQFLVNAVYYENNDASEDDYELPSDASPCEPRSSITGVKDWNLLETHLYNLAFHKRSSIWMYLPHATLKFLYVSDSDINTLILLNENYVNQTMNQTTYCAPPITYFMEPKENDLCLCTFWGANIDSWQTHYGRSTSCTWKKETLDFHEHFKIDVHSRQEGNIKVRVYADLSPPYEKLLQDYFVLHAVYLQGMDQYGVPVGRFRKGHWIDQLNPNDPRCPNSQFPPVSNPVNQQYPIFDTRECPGKFDYTSTESVVLKKYIKINPTENPNIFLYSNRWKDNFPVVCALFLFNPKHYPHVTHVQIMAYVRIEDKHDDGHAYMIELRTDFYDVADLANSAPQSFAQGKFEDKNVSYPPLNYGYYKFTIRPTQVQWDRPCLEPVREPDRKFDVCRHYIVTPLLSKLTDKVDLEEEIDVYNHLCIQWIIANQKFGPSHPYSVKLGEKLDSSKTERDDAILDNACFSLQAFRTRRKNAWHIRFRVNSSDTTGYCDSYNIPYLKEAALVAYNEEGFPTGRAGGRLEFGGSFELYNHFGTYDRGAHEHCNDDDIQLTLDDIIDNNKMVFHSEKGKCIWSDNNVIDAYKTKPDSFHQDFDLPSEDYVPSMMIWGNFKKLYDGFCAIWFYPKITLPKVTPPKTIQFVMQVQIVQKGVQPPVSDPKGARNRLLTIRSPKYLFNYDGSMVKNLVNGKPALYEDSIHPGNLDASVGMGCHDEELPIDEEKKPNDNCVCELRSLNPPVGTTLIPHPVDDRPLCTLKYAFYNNIFDNRLYRTCLQLERRRDNDDNFKDDECRTRLEYPRPPEIFPNEEITLEGSDEEDYNNTFFLEPFDPTEDAYYGCGLIKRCISPFSSLQVERDCLKDKSCGFIVTFGKGLGESHHTHDEVTIEIFAIARGWAAVGISPEDEKMGEDYVIECVKEGAEVNIYNSWNIKSFQPGKRSHNNYRMRGDMSLYNQRDPIVRPVKTVFYEDALYCKFYMKKKFTRIDPEFNKVHKYDLDVAYHYLMAFSHASTDPYGEDEGNLRIHVLNGGVSEEGKGKIVGGERISPLPHETRKFRLHAMFMVFCWILFLTLSIFVARYFKETLINVHIFKMDFWYFVHLTAGILALFCLAIAVAFHLHASGGWKSQFRSNFHTYSGIVAFCLFVSEFILGFLLQRHAQGKRPLINWIHTVFGHFAYILALFNMTFSDRVAYSFLSCNFETYLILWTTVYCVLHAFMSYHYCWVNFNFAKNAIRQRFSTFNVLSHEHHHISVEVAGADTNRFLMKKQQKLDDLEAHRRASHARTEAKLVEAPGKYIRVTALILFSVITLVYTYWILRKLVTFPRFCYDFHHLKDLEENGFN